MDHEQLKHQLEALKGLDVVQRATELVKIAQTYLDDYNKGNKDEETKETKQI